MFVGAVKPRQAWTRHQQAEQARQITEDVPLLHGCNSWTSASSGMRLITAIRFAALLLACVNQPWRAQTPPHLVNASRSKQVISGSGNGKVNIPSILSGRAAWPGNSLQVRVP
jgi:hypothetical protein